MENYIKEVPLKGKSMYCCYAVWESCIGYHMFGNYEDAKKASEKYGDYVELACFIGGECVDYKELESEPSVEKIDEFVQHCTDVFDEEKEMEKETFKITSEQIDKLHEMLSPEELRGGYIVEGDATLCFQDYENDNGGVVETSVELKLLIDGDFSFDDVPEDEELGRHWVKFAYDGAEFRGTSGDWEEICFGHNIFEMFREAYSGFNETVDSFFDNY